MLESTVSVPSSDWFWLSGGRSFSLHVCIVSTSTFDKLEARKISQKIFSMLLDRSHCGCCQGGLLIFLSLSNYQHTQKVVSDSPWLVIILHLGYIAISWFYCHLIFSIVGKWSFLRKYLRKLKSLTKDYKMIKFLGGLWGCLLSYQI